MLPETFYSWKHVRILGTKSIFHVENINEPFAPTQQHHLYERVGLFLQFENHIIHVCIY